MSAFNFMAFFYGAMIGVPLLLMAIAFMSQFPQYHQIRVALAVLLGIGSIVFGIIGFKEVFIHGNRRTG